jgi:isopenicillin-N N-acyltransferase like protein
MTPVPLIRAAGNHRDVGEQIGAATADVVREAAAKPFDAGLVRRYHAVTKLHLPWIVEELEGVAAGAGADPAAVFARSVEELEAAIPGTGCTDLVCTLSDRVLVAHNNDLEREDEENIVAIEWRVDGEPTIFTLGIGPWISVGWNDAGLSVTGNEVSPNDERVGIPRLLQMRDVLVRTTLEDAVAATLHPARASSYNWVLAHPVGGAIDIEGSATDAELIAPNGQGRLAHTNHYVHARMAVYEQETSIVGSQVRWRRAQQLLDEPRATSEDLQTALADHENSPDSLCRHEGAIKTVFWCVADLGAGEIRYGRGNPCDSETQVYRFER